MKCLKTETEYVIKEDICLLCGMPDDGLAEWTDILN